MRGSSHAQCNSNANALAAGVLVDLLGACVRYRGSESVRYRGSILREFGNAGVRFVRNRWTEWFAGGQDAIMVEVAVVIVGEEEEWQ